VLVLDSGWALGRGAVSFGFENNELPWTGRGENRLSRLG